MNYPLLLDVTAYDDIQDGFNQVFSGFNAFHELLSRQDIVESVIEMLATFSLTITKVKNEKATVQGILSFKYMLLEHIVTQKEFLKGLDNEKLKKLSDIISGNITLMMNNRNIFSNRNIKTRKALLDNLIIDDKIVAIVGRTFAYDIDTLIKTPNQTTINAHLLGDTDFSPTERDTVDRYYEQVYSVTVDSSATAKYNCHGYAWHMYNEKSHEPVFFNDPPSEYTTDYSYEVCDSLEAEIVYYVPSHSARRYAGTTFISKWGTGPVIRHSLTDSRMPYNYYEKRYYKRAIPEIVGATYPCGATTYYVTKTPPNDSIDVTWSYTSVPSNISATLTQNYPSRNRCTFNYNGTGNYTAYLTATVSRGGHVIGTATKTITNQFGITFSQIGRTYNGYTYPDIPETSIENNSTKSTRGQDRCVICVFT